MAVVTSRASDGARDAGLTRQCLRSDKLFSFNHPKSSKSMSSSFAAYFSHSWDHRDLPVNLMLWQQIAEHCHLVIDQPQPSSEEERPYFISRLESMMRHADVMMCCLPAAPPEKRTERVSGATGDWRYNACSPYILFELRLAERLDLPRLVLTDRDSRFKLPRHSAPHVRYIERNFSELRELNSMGRKDDRLIGEIEDWLKWVKVTRTSSTWTPPVRTACLLGTDSDLNKRLPVVKEAIDAGCFEPPEALSSLFHTDAELYQVLRSLGLLIVDVSQPELLPLYHAAHSLMVPTIRIDTSEAVTNDQLPAILQGHPAGYQLDILKHSAVGSDELLFARLQDRSSATAKTSSPIVGKEAGESLLHQRTYSGEHFVFISHDERLNDRQLVDLVVSELKSRGVTCWEYAVENRSGDLWEKKMWEALRKTTLMVSLMSPTFSDSPGCKDEWEYALKSSIPLLPYLTRGRIKPKLELRGRKLAHQPLFDTRPVQERAMQVVGKVIDDLRATP